MLRHYGLTVRFYFQFKLVGILILPIQYIHYTIHRFVQSSLLVVRNKYLDFSSLLIRLNIVKNKRTAAGSYPLNERGMVYIDTNMKM